MDALRKYVEKKKNKAEKAKPIAQDSRDSISSGIVSSPSARTSVDSAAPSTSRRCSSFDSSGIASTSARTSLDSSAIPLPTLPSSEELVPTRRPAMRRASSGDPSWGSASVDMQTTSGTLRRSSSEDSRSGLGTPSTSEMRRSNSGIVIVSDESAEASVVQSPKDPENIVQKFVASKKKPSLSTLKVLEVIEAEAEKEKSKSKGSAKKSIFRSFGHSKGKKVTKELSSSTQSLPSEIETQTVKPRRAVSEDRKEKTADEGILRSLIASFFSGKKAIKVIEEAAPQESPVSTEESCTSPKNLAKFNEPTAPVSKQKVQNKNIARRITDRLGLTKRDSRSYPVSKNEEQHLLEATSSPDVTESLSSPPPPEEPHFKNVTATRPPPFAKLGDSFKESFESDSLDKDYVSRPDTENSSLPTDTPNIVSPKSDTQFPFDSILE